MREPMRSLLTHWDECNDAEVQLLALRRWKYINEVLTKRGFNAARSMFATTLGVGTPFQVLSRLTLSGSELGMDAWRYPNPAPKLGA